MTITKSTVNCSEAELNMLGKNVPAHLAEDREFFLQHLNDEKFEIESYFDKEHWKINTVYRMRISHIYDPSHFWVVCKENELDTLVKYLYDFYSKYKTHYKIPVTNLKGGSYCISYTDGAFYRSVLVDGPLAIEKKSWVFVFLIDFGYMAKVPAEEIYFMSVKMYSIPRLSIRASLSGLCPIGSTTWSTNATTRFSNLANNKILLCHISGTDHTNKVLFLSLGEYNWEIKSFESLNNTFIIEKFATQMTIADVKIMKHAEKKKHKRNKEKILPFLLPSFDEIETGHCTDTVVAARYLDTFTCK